MEDFLEIYWILNDDSTISVYDLTVEETHEFMKNASLVREEELLYFITIGHKILVPHEEEGGGILYDSLENLRRKEKVGFRTNSIYFQFNPSYDDFLSNRFNYINKLSQQLNLDFLELDFSKERILYFENLLQRKNYKHRQEIEKLFLGLVAYWGECFIKKYNAKWFNTNNNLNKELWIPLIELDSGLVIDIFPTFFEGLHIYLEGKHNPMLWFQTDLTQAKPKKHYIPQPKRDRFLEKFGLPFKKTNEDIVPKSFIAELYQEELKELFSNESPITIKNLQFPPTISVYQLKNKKILLLIEPALKGYLYNSLEDFY